MNTIGDRIVAIIESKGLSKTDLANTLKVTQPYISKIVNKGAMPSERLLEDICEKLDVNREWLENGTGDMFVTLTRDENISDFMTDLLKEEDESFRKRLISALAALDTEDWKDLERIANKLINKKD